MAVLLVALSHANVKALAGGYVGVDVFFVISGFLITGWLVRHSAKKRGMPFRDFYAARARRLLPAAALTLVVTAVASGILLNFVRARAVFHDSIWAVFFAANVHFAHIGTNYFASTATPSPIQHYWSLAVEEQFYLLWPALLMVVLFLARRRPFSYYDENGHPTGRRISQHEVDGAAVRRVGIVLGVVVVASLAWSIHDTRAHPTAAYFSAFTRAWELGVGGLVAVGANQLERISAPTRALLGWVGLAGVFYAAFAFDSTTVFPGDAALLPVVGTALVIVAGMGAASRVGPGLILGRQPLRFVGDVSYSFYLWHWPVLIIALGYWGHTLTIAQNLLLLLGAFGLSVVTYSVFENPLHRGRTLANPWYGLSMWPVTIGAVVLAVTIGLAAVHTPTTHTPSLADQQAFAAQFSTTTVAATPTPGGGGKKPVKTAPDDPYADIVAASVAPARLASRVSTSSLTPAINDLQTGEYLPHECAAAFGSATSSKICHLGATGSARKLVVFGDSHLQMWMTALIPFAKNNNWDLVPIFKEGCPSATFGGGNKAQAPACIAWNAWAMEQMQQIKPTAIVYAMAYAQAASLVADNPQALSGLTLEINSLVKVSPKVVVLGDTPNLRRDPVDCLLAGGATYGSCSWQLSGGLVEMNSQLVRLTKSEGALFLPTLQWFCSGGHCPTVIGDTVAFMDTGHISPTYATQLTDPLSVKLEAVLG